MNKKGSVPLIAGRYQFAPQQKIIKHDGKIIHLWGPQDVLVMKLIANRPERVATTL
jgi:hypothetical protein